MLRMFDFPFSFFFYYVATRDGNREIPKLEIWDFWDSHILNSGIFLKLVSKFFGIVNSCCVNMKLEQSIAVFKKFLKNTSQKNRGKSNCVITSTTFS